MKNPEGIWLFYAVVGFFLAMQFQFGWKLFGFLIVAALKTARWLCIIGMVTALLTATPTYLALGWTPLSLIFGDKVYDRALQRGAFDPSTAVTPPRRTKGKDNLAGATR